MLIIPYGYRTILVLSYLFSENVILVIRVMEESCFSFFLNSSLSLDPCFRNRFSAVMAECNSYALSLAHSSCILQ